MLPYVPACTHTYIHISKPYIVTPCCQTACQLGENKSYGPVYNDFLITIMQENIFCYCYYFSFVLFFETEVLCVTLSVLELIQ